MQASCSAPAPSAGSQTPPGQASSQKVLLSAPCREGHEDAGIDPLHLQWAVCCRKVPELQEVFPCNKVYRSYWRKAYQVAAAVIDVVLGLSLRKVCRSIWATFAAAVVLEVILTAAMNPP